MHSSAEEYNSYVNYSEVREKEWKNARLMVKVKDRNYSRTKQGHSSAFLSHPSLGSPVKTMTMFLARIPPSLRSGKHRHNCEALIFIVKGRGYSVIDGARHNWEEGDSFSVPPMSWHQHFNSDSEKEAEYLAVTNIPLMMSVGTFVLEQAEDAGS